MFSSIVFFYWGILIQWFFRLVDSKNRLSLVQNLFFCVHFMTNNGSLSGKNVTSRSFVIFITSNILFEFDAFFLINLLFRFELKGYLPSLECFVQLLLPFSQWQLNLLCVWEFLFWNLGFKKLIQNFRLKLQIKDSLLWALLCWIWVQNKRLLLLIIFRIDWLGLCLLHFLSAWLHVRRFICHFLYYFRRWFFCGRLTCLYRSLF